MKNNNIIKWRTDEPPRTCDSYILAVFGTAEDHPHVVFYCKFETTGIHDDDVLEGCWVCADFDMVADKIPRYSYEEDPIFWSEIKLPEKNHETNWRTDEPPREYDSYILAVFDKPNKYPYVLYWKYYGYWCFADDAMSTSDEDPIFWIPIEMPKQIISGEN